MVKCEKCEKCENNFIEEIPSFKYEYDKEIIKNFLSRNLRIQMKNMN